ncbi:hypothetical protein LZ32DRAFT_613494 [Colletotrichum eremochloae]|nr:hypothetical protein LZ32DRAFT_613494 [Colletotrichum eremochloae]
MYMPGKAILLLIATWVFLAPALAQGSDKPFTQPSKRERKPVNQILVVSGLKSWWNKHSCGIQETLVIKNAIKRMRKYAIDASNFLEADNSYTTAAYVAWFGVQNANPVTAKGIINNIYNPIKALGKSPLGQINELAATEGAVVIGCSRDKNECKGKRALAWAGDEAIIELCPEFFQDLFRDEEVSVQEWQARRELIKTQSRTLLHEMTHLKALAGNWETDDYARSYEVPERDNSDFGLLTYIELSRLVGLDDWHKIRNAENYALFALDVYVNPSHAAQPVNLHSNAVIHHKLD